MSLTLTMKEKAEERKLILDQNNAILTKAADEKRELTALEQEEFEKRHAAGDKLLADVQRIQKQLTAESTLTEPRADPRKAGFEDRGGDEPLSDAEQKALGEKRNAAMVSYFRYGESRLNEEERQLIGPRAGTEQRGLVKGTNDVGGFTVGQDSSLMSNLEIAKKQFGLDESMFQVYNTANGQNLPIPTVDDTDNEDSAHTEANAEDEGDDPTFGQLVLGAFTRTTKVIKVSLELLQDSSVDIEAKLGELLGERIGRSKARLLTVGTDTTQPQGITIGATLGKTAASASGITYAELLDLQHSVDPAYRNANSRYMFHDTTLRAVKGLVDDQNRPLFIPGYADREPDRINGYQYVINQAMPIIGAGNRSVVFGDMRKFVVRNVRGLSILRLTERYAEAGVVGFIAFPRYDSGVLDAGTHPIKYLVHPSSS